LLGLPATEVAGCPRVPPTGRVALSRKTEAVFSSRLLIQMTEASVHFGVL